MMLMRWKLKILEERPEILPEFELFPTEVWVRCKDVEDALHALSIFPKESGYQLKIFVGDKLYWPPPRRK